MIALSCASYIFPKLIGLNKLLFSFVLHVFILLISWVIHTNTQFGAFTSWWT